jgi:TonB family protein
MHCTRDLRLLAVLPVVIAALSLSTLACGIEPADAREQIRPPQSIEVPRKGPHPEWMLRPAEKVTLSVREMDIREFARLLSERVRVPIVPMGSAEGNVTIEVVDTPWDEALARAIAPLGLRYEILDQSIVITMDGGAFSGGEEPPDDYLRVGGDVRPPEVLTRVEPIATEEARKARMSGVVILQVLIDQEGRVDGAKVLKGLPKGLNEAALAAVRQWTFSPGTLHGKPVKVVYMVTVDFKLSK